MKPWRWPGPCRRLSPPKGRSKSSLIQRTTTTPWPLICSARPATCGRRRSAPENCSSSASANRLIRSYLATSVSQFNRIASEKIFHDRQAVARAHTFVPGAFDLRFDDDFYLDHESWIRPAIAQLGDVSGKRIL